jgi:hypothetical protein
MMKICTLAAAMTALVAISHQAQAGTTISDQRYWPSEVASSQRIARLPVDAFASTLQPHAIQSEPHRYSGGPKSND